MGASQFGPIITRLDVEAAVVAHLQAWSLTYIAEVERQQELDAESLPPIRNYTTVGSGIEKWPEDQLPMLLIMSTGLAEPPKREGRGLYRASWNCGIAAITAGGGADPADSAKRTAGYYQGAVRAAMLQHPSLGGFAAGVTWVDERYDELPVEQSRSMAAASGFFRIEVEGVADSTGGVATVPDNPYDSPPDLPTADELELEVNPTDDTP